MQFQFCYEYGTLKLKIIRDCGIWEQVSDRPYSTAGQRKNQTDAEPERQRKKGCETDRLKVLKKAILKNCFQHV